MRHVADAQNFSPTVILALGEDFKLQCFCCNANGFDIDGGVMKILNCFASNNNGHGQNHEANVDMHGAKNACIDGFTRIGGRLGIHNGNPDRPSNGTVIRDARFYSPRDAGIELDGTTNCYIEDTNVEAIHRYMQGMQPQQQLRPTST
ncbi:MAG: hypothetical protein M3P08_16700 [Thermoproteota archaeon]|nr:hypothetical protein [Thermoproteota archaeon]